MPLRKGYSSGRNKKERQAQRLREIIGVDGTDASIGGIFQTIEKMAAPRLQAEQESITGDQDEIHETDGVRWQIKTLAFGLSPISRWQSADVALPNNFIYLTQKMKGQKQPASNKLTQIVYEKLFAQSLNIYGYREMAAPYLDKADIYPVEARLSRDFFAFASDAAIANKILTPWTTMPLANWANRHPFKENTNEQLALFYGPQGLF
ncbi:MAG: hypothetical protein L3J16_04820 [Anaerolineales bacterium]|nr:hypothetical protein [Anaerolineales bacterium]